ncbi:MULTISPECIES: DUF4097 family beta strand repeat-containing protein [Thermocrispum]|jgi:hypothetical protein|uniref:DUF4097 family beta strand repeat-containing protein n=1 Tax=Thermocrispum agreste TaxID=37925 RepID=A0A2W4JAP5_9PSEU|nr:MULTISPECIES: DUF4097 family beta strand repeat-containing protein [Thermocrispum]PZM96110.1 MAG: hypothetical protein DIU77_11330 [Thermocrispum agreste]
MSRTVKFVAGVALLAVAVGLVTGWFWRSEATTVERVDQRINTVEIDNESGDVVVRAADVTTIEVRQKFSYRFTAPDRAFSVDGSTLTLDGCGWWCAVDYEVIVPRSVKVVGEIDSGDLQLVGTIGGEIELNSGDAVVRDVTGPLSIRANSGDVTVTGMSSDLTVKANSGDVTAELAKPANVTADIDSGSIQLTVPEGRYQVDGQTDSGRRDIRIGNTPGAPYRLQLDTDSGNVLVRTAS